MERSSASLGRLAYDRTRLDFRLGLVIAPALLLGAALAVRVVWLEADAARNLSWSGALFTDEGLYSHAARNAALFGTWRTNGWDDRLVSPLHAGLVYVVFRAFGVGYVQLRLISVVLSMIALIGLWRMLRRDFDERVGMIGATLWGLDYFWFQYSRLGFLEPGVVLWLVVAAWSWRRAVDRQPRWALLAGGAAALAWVWKSLALVVAPAPLLALLVLVVMEQDVPVRRRYMRLATVYVAGFGAVAFVYSVAWYLPHRSELATYNQFYASARIPQSLGELGWAMWRNARSPYIWAQTPVIGAAALLGIVRACRAWQRRAVPPAVVLSLAWLVCGLALLGMPYSPPRYYTLLMPPLVYLACYAIAFTDHLNYRRSIRAGQWLLLSASLAWSGAWYFRWASARQTTLPTTSRALGSLLPRGTLVVGISACGLSLANELRCAPPMPGLANDAEPVATFNAQYALVESNPNDYMQRFQADLLARSTPLRTFPFGTQRVTLYQLVDEPR